MKYLGIENKSYIWISSRLVCEVHSSYLMRLKKRSSVYMGHVDVCSLSLSKSLSHMLIQLGYNHITLLLPLCHCNYRLGSLKSTSQDCLLQFKGKHIHITYCTRVLFSVTWEQRVSKVGTHEASFLVQSFLVRSRIVDSRIQQYPGYQHYQQYVIETTRWDLTISFKFVRRNIHAHHLNCGTTSTEDKIENISIDNAEFQNTLLRSIQLNEIAWQYPLSCFHFQSCPTVTRTSSRSRRKYTTETGTQLDCWCYCR